MLTIKAPYIQEDSIFATLYCDIIEDNELKSIWFQVDAKYKEYLVNDRIDAYVIALLNYAMRNGHDIQSEYPVTERLYYQLDTYLIDALFSTSNKLYRTKLLTPTTTQELTCAGAVGTGISCGIDSLHAVSLNSKTNNKSLNISHLCFNNVGSHGEGERANNLFEGRRKLAKSFCIEYGYEYVESNSNLMDVFIQNHYLTHTYSSSFAIFSLRKLYSYYYYASSDSIFNFSLIDNSMFAPGRYELLSFYSFSLDNFVIYTEGALKSRNDKLRAIINYAPSYKYLNVCTELVNNCSKCEKCIRTLVGLDSLGVLDRYAQVFDIEYYRSNRSWYLSQLFKYYSLGKTDYVDPYKILKNDISFLSKLRGYLSIMRYKITKKYRDTFLYNLCKKIYLKVR
ncbi:MAG: hypothetical protein ACRCZQ_09440 [Bacteroidales bacterium]